MEKTSIWSQPHYRWRITALLFFATTINYLDRSVLSILAPQLQHDYKWTEIDYGYIIAAFQVAYGVGVILAGQLLDKFGSRILFALAVGLWSLAGIGHAMARTALSFAAARFFLGLGEAANFPASIKTVAEWFPKKERAFVTGLFNAGSNIGAIVSPLLVPFIAIHYGWQWAFIATGILGFIWLLFWLNTYTLPEQSKKLTKEELEYIQADQEPSVKGSNWLILLTRRETIALCLARFLTDPVWWFLLYWLPKFLEKQYQVSLTNIGLPLVIIYLAADFGGIAGGWLSSALIKSGTEVYRSRKIAMLVCAFCVVPVMLIAQNPTLCASVALISLAAAAHQGWAANIYTIVSDVFPKNEVATVVGLSTAVAVVGSMLAATAIGWILDRTGSYALIFSIAGCMYLLAWLILRIGIQPGKKQRDQFIPSVQNHLSNYN